MDFQRFPSLLTDNELWPWLVKIAIAIAITFVAKILLKGISSRLRWLTKRTSSKWDNVSVDLLDGLRTWVLFIWAFYASVKTLGPSDLLQRIFLIVVVVATAYQVIIWGLHIIRTWHSNVLKRKTSEDPSASAALSLLAKFIQGLFIAVIVLIGLENLGVDVTALMAGLGIGGIAVALAAQNILGDLFASLSIVLDKPFVIGDFIVSGDEKGTVEQIGIKTTRLRSLEGEEVVLSNRDLLESRVRNYKRMWKRRVVHRFGVRYETPAEKLEQIPVWVKEFVQKHEKLDFDRCHFMAFGSASLDFELVFFVEDPDYNVYMDFQQNVLLDIMKKFSNEEVRFALPAQTVFLEKTKANRFAAGT